MVVSRVVVSRAVHLYSGGDGGTIRLQDTLILLSAVRGEDGVGADHRELGEGEAQQLQYLENEQCVQRETLGRQPWQGHRSN